MKEVFVTTQDEWDALPRHFEEYTRIIIRNTNGIYIRVEARGNSSIEARENSSVVARENSSVEARENSNVEAWGNSSVVARENSNVVAWENSSVEAWENSSVEAWGNSSVVAWGNAVVRIWSAATKTLLHGFAVAFIAASLGAKVEVKSQYAKIQNVQQVDWWENNAVEKCDVLTLYKRVSFDFKTQEGTENETLWNIGTVVTIPKWEPHREECGKNKFHACSRAYFCDEFRNKSGDRYIAVEVKLADTYIWENPVYPHKIAFREGVVLYECDRFGKRIAALAKADPQ